MFEKFTKEAKGVVLEAIAQAEQRDDRRVSTEHLMLAIAEVSPLLDYPTLDASLRRLDEDALRVVGIDPQLASLDLWRSAVRKKKHVPFTSDAKKVLTDSLHETLDMGDRTIGVTHLLLALTRLDNENRAIKAMVSSGVDPVQLRESLRGRLAS